MIIEGIDCAEVSVALTEISEGDLYMAKRNTGWKLLECCEYKDNVVYPKGIEYPYNSCECFRVLN